MRARILIAWDSAWKILIQYSDEGEGLTLRRLLNLLAYATTAASTSRAFIRV